MKSYNIIVMKRNHHIANEMIGETNEFKSFILNNMGNKGSYIILQEMKKFKL
jgi:hypothetical protein